MDEPTAAEELTRVFLICLGPFYLQYNLMGLVDCQTWMQRLLRVLIPVPLLLLGVSTYFMLLLAVEAIREYDFRKTEATKLKAFEDDGISTPLLTTSRRSDAQGRHFDPIVGPVLAINVSACRSTGLKRGIPVASLPTCVVQLPISNMARVAVLSWKWDIKPNHPTEVSKNIKIALTYAKRKGIQYLLVDIISIDQTLPHEILLKQVSLFATLYATLPVICAYDEPRLIFEHIIMRPWIFSEVKNMLQNPHQIVYLGYLTRSHGTYERSYLGWLTGLQLRSRMQHTNIVNGLRLVWTTDFVTCLLHVLNGYINMTNIHDIKFIIRSLKEILEVAEELAPNDYLMTAILMSSMSRFGQASKHETRSIFTTLPYSTYEIRSRTHEVNVFPDVLSTVFGSRIRTEHREHHTVLLGGRTVATFECFERDWKIDQPVTYTLKVHHEMERRVFEMLCLNLHNPALYREQQADLRLQLGHNTIVSYAHVDVVRMRI